jgi:hypothetical protein
MGTDITQLFMLSKFYFQRKKIVVKDEWRRRRSGRSRKKWFLFNQEQWRRKAGNKVARKRRRSLSRETMMDSQKNSPSYCWVEIGNSALFDVAERSFERSGEENLCLVGKLKHAGENNCLNFTCFSLFFCFDMKVALDCFSGHSR